MADFNLTISISILGPFQTDNLKTFITLIK